MTRDDYTKLIYSGKYPLPMDFATKKSYRLLVYRSTISNGRISSIHLPELPDNYLIIQGKDLKNNTFKIGTKTYPVLATDKIGYKGEPILIITGPEITELKKIFKAVEIEYESLEDSVYTSDPDVLYSKSVAIGDNSKDELYKSITGTIKTPTRIIQTKFLYGSFTKRDADTLTNYSSTSWPELLRENISRICGFPQEDVHVIHPVVTGERENSMIDGSLSSIYSAIATTILKKNVLYSPTSEDQYMHSSRIYGLTANWKMNFNRDNNLLGLEVTVTLPCGAYPILIEEKVLRILHGITSFYKHRNIKITVNAIRTSYTPSGLSNGLYLSDALFIAELLTSKIIKECRGDQLQWRLDNLLQKGYKNSTNAIIKSDIPLEEMLRCVSRDADFSRKNSSINLLLSRREKRIKHLSKRGIGISVGYNGNNFISNDRKLSTNLVTVELLRDNRVEVHINSTVEQLDMFNVWEDIINQILNIEVENITINLNSITPGPNTEDKNINIITPLIKQCCEEIKTRRFKDPLPIVQQKQTRRKSKVVWNESEWKGDPFKNTAYATCVTEVEVDRRSLTCILKEIWLYLEVGQIIDKQMLMNSIRREILACIKWLQEEYTTREDFYNCPIVSAEPQINITIYETNKNRNLIKSVGSLVFNTLPAAYIQAVSQALGANINSFPVKRETIYRELRKDEI